jgi:hypothetical protein
MPESDQTKIRDCFRSPANQHVIGCMNFRSCQISKHIDMFMSSECRRVDAHAEQEGHKHWPSLLLATLPDAHGHGSATRKEAKSTQGSCKHRKRPERQPAACQTPPGRTLLGLQLLAVQCIRAHREKRRAARGGRLRAPVETRRPLVEPLLPAAERQQQQTRRREQHRDRDSGEGLRVRFASAFEYAILGSVFSPWLSIRIRCQYMLRTSNNVTAKGVAREC